MLMEEQTLELSKLQVGDKGPANFIVSTLMEAENLLPYLIESQAQGHEASVSRRIRLMTLHVPHLTPPRCSMVYRYHNLRFNASST